MMLAGLSAAPPLDPQNQSILEMALGEKPGFFKRIGSDLELIKTLFVINLAVTAGIAIVTLSQKR